MERTEKNFKNVVYKNTLSKLVKGENMDPDDAAHFAREAHDTARQLWLKKH